MYQQHVTRKRYIYSVSAFFKKPVCYNYYMATRKQAISEAAKHGATLDIDLQYGRYEARAAAGRRWQSNNCAVFIVDYGYRGDTAAAYAELIDGMNWGYM